MEWDEHRVSTQILGDLPLARQEAQQANDRMKLARRTCLRELCCFRSTCTRTSQVIKIVAISQDKGGARVYVLDTLEVV